MANAKHTQNLKSHKNEILNFLAQKSKTFYFSFLNSKGKVGSMNIGTREDWNACHFRVQYFDNSAEYKTYEEPKGYYVTFNGFESYNNDGVLCMSLRKDLVDYWANCDVKNKHVLFVADRIDAIVDFEISKVIQYCIDHEKQNVVYNNKFGDYIIPIDDAYYLRKEYQIHTEPKDLTFDVNYYKPEYISNMSYSVYRSGTAVKVVMYDKEGNYLRERVYRSIKEVYDALVKAKSYDKSYKTLQRQVAEETVITTPSGMKFFITSDIDKSFKDENYEVVEVIDEKYKNPFYMADEPEGPTNPKMLDGASHFELRKPMREDAEKHFDEIKETDFYDDELETEIRDDLEQAKNELSEEQQKDFAAKLAEYHRKYEMMKDELRIENIGKRPQLYSYAKKPKEYLF